MSMARILTATIGIALVGLILGLVVADGWLIGLFGAVSVAMLGMAIGAGFSRRGDPREMRVDFPAAAVRRELNRARRHTIPLGLIRISGPRSVTLASVTAAMGDMSRETDLAWVAGGFGYLLLPDTARDGVLQVAGRLRHQVPDLTGARVDASVFPDDGITLGALVAALQQADAPQPMTLPSPVRVGVRTSER